MYCTTYSYSTFDSNYLAYIRKEHFRQLQAFNLKLFVQVAQYADLAVCRELLL
jgi:hypothetical protein